MGCTVHVLDELFGPDPPREDPRRRHGGAGRLPAQRSHQRPPERDLRQRRRDDHHRSNLASRTHRSGEGDLARFRALQHVACSGHVLLFRRHYRVGQPCVGQRACHTAGRRNGNDPVGKPAVVGGGGRRRLGWPRTSPCDGEGASVHRQQRARERDDASRFVLVVRVAHGVYPGLRGEGDGPKHLPDCGVHRRIVLLRVLVLPAYHPPQHAGQRRRRRRR
mmetsp:Transcript_5670/g.16018  ORF Transcript_5670/g.16018 Transcript_5670/m.16018 type:complete len:220 (-) Transcript_5670:591-1250(-)